MKNTKQEEQLLIKLFSSLVIFCAQFLTARLQFLVQDIKVSLEYVDFYTKESLILDTRASNSTTPLALISILSNLDTFGI